MKNEWENQSVNFDHVYSGDGFLNRVPYFGSFVRKSLTERMERAIAFAEPCDGKTIIDLGCGVGRIALEIARRGALVIGYDISIDAITIASQQAKEAGLDGRCTFQHGDLEVLNFPPADAWIDLGCLQYVRDIEHILTKLKNVKHCYSTLPRRGYWLNPIRFLYRGILKGSPFYTYNQDDVRKLFGMYSGLNIEEDRGVHHITA